MSDERPYPYHTGEYVENGAVVMLPCKHCEPGRPCSTVRGTFDQVPGSDAAMFIQWKGTDVCMDFQCSCAPDDEAYAFHFDGMFAYIVECPRCHTMYELGTQVRARRLSDDERGWLGDQAKVLEDSIAREAEERP